MTRKIIFLAAPYGMGGLAQRLEQDAHNVLVGGSNPSAPTINTLELKMKHDFRGKARKTLEKAKAELASNDDSRLKYTA